MLTRWPKRAIDCGHHARPAVPACLGVNCGMRLARIEHAETVTPLSRPGSHRHRCRSQRLRRQSPILRQRSSRSLENPHPPPLPLRVQLRGMCDPPCVHADPVGSRSVRNPESKPSAHRRPPTRARDVFRSLELGGRLVPGPAAAAHRARSHLLVGGPVEDDALDPFLARSSSERTPLIPA